MGNIYLAPYISAYADIIRGSFSIVCWNREKINEKYPNAIVYSYNNELKVGSKTKKIRGYIGYRKYIIKILTAHDFDEVVLLQTWGALLLNKFLVKKYSGRYIVDVRDYTYEKNLIVRIVEQYVFKKAGMCVISSKGYKAFLPKGIKYYVAHNIRNLSFDEVKEIRCRKREKEILSIAFIGFVEYQEQHKKLIMALKNDSRFRLLFVGTKALDLEDFCRINNVKNVILIDTFDSKNILNYYRDVDIVNNLYGNNTPTLDYALSNKLYFAAELHMPILVCPNTYMQKITQKYNMSITVSSYNVSLGDYIWDQYSQIDWSSLDNSCDDFMNLARKEQKLFIEKVGEMLN